MCTYQAMHSAHATIVHLHTYTYFLMFISIRFKYHHPPIVPLRDLLYNNGDPYFEDLNYSLRYFRETFLAAVVVWVIKVGRSSKPP